MVSFVTRRKLVESGTGLNTPQHVQVDSGHSAPSNLVERMSSDIGVCEV